MAERALSPLRRPCLAGRIEDKATLLTEVHAGHSHRNARNAKAYWQFTTADARVKLRRLYPTILS